ncbi:MAG: SusD/RagB family nutrient-binding outer rane lipoprotein [Bacteroidetes bacterium]|nr:SusD/RagB family nutrient-binding outer rane lipoprotein [Bacteroidota bacterium]MBP1676648.1 SusD/RagB family nutrient-binding outer rane lipoprotein [Bacteroidota bacterium]
MKKIKKYNILVAIILGIFLMGCTDNFDELNTNPNTVTTASPSMLATNVILGMVKYGGADASAYLSQYFLPKYQGSAYGLTVSQYNQVGKGYFSFTSVQTINKMLEMAEGNPQKESYQAIAKFSRAMTFWNATISLGDIPYSEAGLASQGNYKPQYDTQETVVLGVLNELKEAEALFAKGINFDGDPTPFAGDAKKWRKAVNAFTLRVLIALSKKTDVASLDVKNRFQSIVSSGFLLDPGTYLGLVYNDVQNHPVYGARNLYYNTQCVSDFVVNNLKRLNDYRLFYFADPAPAKISAGYTEGDMAAYNGMDVVAPFNQIQADNNQRKLFSLVNGRYYDVKASEPRVVMGYVEQQFALAEARIRGWITTGTAKDYYESGVKASLSFYMATDASKAHTKPITQTYIDNYFTGDAAFATTPDEQLKQIWMQRYLAGFMQPQYESFNYLLNNYPDLPYNEATNLNTGVGGGFPKRNMYPDSEYSYNLDNLIIALKRQWNGSDDPNNVMWILK